ncbi:MAG: hypothetical protein IPH79_06495 [Sphingomonadales bacterium]|nr:hypothetical protein [Sphingomonadales bacterium]
MSLQRILEIQWLVMKLFWYASFFFGLIIVASNFSSAISDGTALPWKDFLFVAGMLLMGTALMWIARRLFNFLAGVEVCKWRST